MLVSWWAVWVVRVSGVAGVPHTCSFVDVPNPLLDDAFRHNIVHSVVLLLTAVPQRRMQRW